MIRLAEPPATLAAGQWQLRALGDDDWRLEQELSRDPDVVRWTLYPPDLTDDGARQLIRRTRDVIAARGGRRYVVTDAGGVAMGTAGVAGSTGGATDAELMYALLPRGRGHGAATATACALTEWALAHGASRVVLLTIEDNVTSAAVAQRAGFFLDGQETRPQRGQPTLMNRWVRTAAAPYRAPEPAEGQPEPG